MVNNGTSGVLLLSRLRRRGSPAAFLVLVAMLWASLHPAVAYAQAASESPNVLF